MRILTFTHLWPNPAAPNFGIFVRNRMQAVARIADVRVVAPVPRAWRLRKREHGWDVCAEIPEFEHQDGLAVYHPRFPMVPKLAVLNGWLLSRSAEDLLRRLRAEFDFDVIDAHWMYPDGYAALRLAHRVGVPAVVTARGTDINGFSSRPDLKPLIRRTMLEADGLIAVSESLAAKMEALGACRSKVSVIPNGVDTRRFHPADRLDARRALGLPANGRLVLGIGNLAPGKGFDLLLEAVALLRARPGFGDVRAAIVGEGPERRRLEARVEALSLGGCAILPGARPHAEIPAWLAACDALCLPTRGEGCPNVVLEAIACGRPVVATAADGVTEVLRGEDCGLLAPGREPGLLASCLAEALERRWPLGAFLDHAGRHSWPAVAEAVVKRLRASARLSEPVVELPRVLVSCPAQHLTAADERG